MGETRDHPNADDMVRKIAAIMCITTLWLVAMEAVSDIAAGAEFERMCLLFLRY